MTDPVGRGGTKSISFGPFSLFPLERRLEKEGVRIDLGNRPLDLLIALAEHPGDVVSNQSLVARVWKKVIVEESSLRVTVANLRRVLGDGIDGARYIVNVPGQGYSFVVPVSRHADDTGRFPATPDADAAAYALPPRLQRIVGRDQHIVTLAELVTTRRLLSIVGPGGMGKTTVAIAVMHALAPAFDGEACFVDLTMVAAPALLTSTIAAILGLKITADDAMQGLIAWLRERHMLLVLDNCEHLIDAVANLAEQLLQATSNVRILATSREPLRSENEHAYWLPPLACPPPHTVSTVEEVLAYPAVQLLVDRAGASRHGFALTQAEVPVVAEICRKLDGIALAIELGAVRIATFGLHGTAALLDNRFRLTWSGRRTAPPRHQTMNAVLDWSYNLLPAFEQFLLRRLAIFVAHFSLDAACHVAGGVGIDDARVVEAVDNLVVKSMIAVETIGCDMRYRLLESTRMYAAEKLAACGEHDAVALLHARFLADRLEHGANAGLDTFDAQDDGANAHIDSLGNLRAALEWSFSARGDARVGIRLCVAAMPLFLALSLLGECERWSEKALGLLESAGGCPRQEIVLREALAISSMFMRGNSPFVIAVIERGLELAVRLGDPAYELRLLAGVTLYQMRIGSLKSALHAASRSRRIAQGLGDPAKLAMAEWTLGVVHHLIGDQARAQHHFESGREQVADTVHLRSHWFGYNQRIGTNVALARTLWLRGKSDQARAMAWHVVESARRGSHPISCCIVLVYATAVFLWRGEWDVAGELIDQLTLHATQHMLAPYQAVAKGLKGDLLVKLGEPGRGVGLLQEAIGGLHMNRHLVQHSLHVVALAEGYVELGRNTEALALLDEALSGDSEVFNTPEMLRIQAQILASMPAPDVERAEACLARARECARRQHALAWELRTATTCAQLMVRQGRRTEARNALDDVMSRIHEGFGTVDYIAANDLLNSIAGS
jgi:predicted ATPase/DNA-binding winged helix-turn-helix (wHTH) protein